MENQQLKELASTEYTLSGATLTIISTVALDDVIIINLYPKEFYKLGTAIYTNNALPIQELERVDKNIR